MKVLPALRRTTEQMQCQNGFSIAATHIKDISALILLVCFLSPCDKRNPSNIESVEIRKVQNTYHHDVRQNKTKIHHKTTTVDEEEL